MLSARLQLADTMMPRHAMMIVLRRPYSRIQPESQDPSTMPVMTALVKSV